MKLLFALAFALLVAGAGSPEPEPAPEAMAKAEYDKGQWVEDLNAVKERCNMKPDRTSRSEHCDRTCRASCSDAELERVAEAFPEWYEEYTKAVRLCWVICTIADAVVFGEIKKPIVWYKEGRREIVPKVVSDR